jgi:hypothetical protein
MSEELLNRVPLVRSMRHWAPQRRAVLALSACAALVAVTATGWLGVQSGLGGPAVEIVTGPVPTGPISFATAPPIPPAVNLGTTIQPTPTATAADSSSAPSAGAQGYAGPIGGYWLPPIASSAPPAPSSTDAAHYVFKYGFDWPGWPQSLSPGERQRVLTMLPFALAATARWDARFDDSLEPEMLLFWTHAEGIGASVSFSNCANESPPLGTSYFSYITGCDSPGFWQLGYGNQFGVIGILKTAFSDMRGDPNNRYLVQRIGQEVLNWDQRQGTTPRCGGYPCLFPAMTIDEIMAGVSLTHMTTDDWWASVLSRDPAINCYMLAAALVSFNHNATRNWVGCYYAKACWAYESDSMGDILAAWPGLRRDAGA